MTAARSPRTVFVTGAAGFIGRALCRQLQAAGHRVVAFDDLSRGRRERVPDGVEFVHGDVRDRAALDNVIRSRRPDWVIHLAALHFIPECIAHPDRTMDVNVRGTAGLLESCRSSSVRGIVFASTAAVYAPSNAPCVEDATPVGPLEIYGESKLAGERLVAAFCEESGMPVTVLRLFNAIGRGETNPHVVPHIFESLQRSDVIDLGNTAPKRDYVDTRDIAEAIVAAAESSEGRRTLNVGTGVAYSVADVVERLRHILDRRISVNRDPARARAGDRELLVANIDRIREATGWSPRYSLDETLRDIAHAYHLGPTG